jgi:hypothetical protein
MAVAAAAPTPASKARREIAMSILPSGFVLFVSEPFAGARQARH